jgi:cobalt/nickel transport system permease protein
MYVVAVLFLAWAWWGMKRTMKRSFFALIALVAALTFVVQLAEFPVAGGGSTWHFLGGTLISMVLGPFAAVISMIITLIIQMLIGDGGISSFGANIFNMAVIGALSFFLAKALAGKKFSDRRLAISVFIASWVSNICTALAVGIETSIQPLAGNLGGITVMVPTMLVWYVPTGFLEGVIAALLVVPLSHAKSLNLHGLNMLRGKNGNSETEQSI